jgi:prefoldin subunit 5
MKVKIKYLEDRLTTMEKSIERLHKMLPRLAREFMQQDKQSNDPFIRVMEQGESDTFRDADTMESDHELI